MRHRFGIVFPCLFTFALAGFVMAADGISMEQARQIALDQAGGGEVVEIHRQGRGRGEFYKVEVDGNNGWYHVQIGADTGKLLKLVQKSDRGHSRRHSQSSARPGDDSARPGSGRGRGPGSATGMDFDQLYSIAIGRSGGGVVVESDWERKHGGGIVYEFEIYNNGVRYEMEIDADTGEITWLEQKSKGRREFPSDSLRMTAAQAANEAISRVGGGYVTSYELERHNAGWVHEIELRYDGGRYEVVIDDETGDIIEYDAK